MRSPLLAGKRRSYGRWIGLFLAASVPLSADSLLMIGGDQTGWPAEANDIVTLSAGSHHVLAP